MRMRTLIRRSLVVCHRSEASDWAPEASAQCV